MTSRDVIDAFSKKHFKGSGLTYHEEKLYGELFPNDKMRQVY